MTASCAKDLRQLNLAGTPQQHTDREVAEFLRQLARITSEGTIQIDNSICCTLVPRERSCRQRVHTYQMEHAQRDLLMTRQRQRKT